MEEPGNLEIATKNVTGKPGDGNRFPGTPGVPLKVTTPA
jgi:hypothetical protein